MNFIWIHRHYTFQGRRVRVTRTFSDTVIIKDVVDLDHKPEATVSRQEFSTQAVIIDEVP